MTTCVLKGSVSQGMMFENDKNPLTLRQFYEMYKPSFPSFFTVTQGYYGEKEMEVLGSGQVIRIHRTVHQKRAVAMDTNNRTLSIPTNYPIKFRTLNANNKRSKDEDELSDILVKNALPVRIVLSERSKVRLTLNNSVNNIQQLGVLTVKELYEETYFLANGINRDGTPHSIALLIPLYLGDIMVTAITGIQGKTTSDWLQYQKTVTEACKTVQIPLDTGLREIALYSPHTVKGSDNVYDYIEPSSYIVATWEGKVQSEATSTVTRHSLKPPTDPKKPSRPPKPAKPPIDYDEPPQLPVRLTHPPRQTNPTNKDTVQYENDIGRVAVLPFNSLANEAAERANVRRSVGQITPNQGQESHTASDRGQAFQRETNMGQAIQSPREITPNTGQTLPVTDAAKPIAELSIDEMAQSMKDLKLQKHVDAFKEQGVDGALALEMSDEILLEDFKFSRFDLLKFAKFIQTGHIPK